MKNKIFSFFGLLLLAQTCMAGPNVSDPTSKLIKSGTQLYLVLQAPEKHHFNLQTKLKAEDSVNHKALLLSSAKESQLAFALSANTKSLVQTTTYICDEKKSYCLKKKVEVDTSKLQIEESQISIEAPKAIQTDKTHAAHEAQKQGFILNDWQKAFELAKAQNKKILIDFFGIWCPPCNMMDAQVFPKKFFQDLKSDFIFLKMDADAKESWELKKRYTVTGYPTLIVTNSSGEELGRHIGFAPLNNFVAFLKNPTPKGATGNEAWRSEHDAAYEAKKSASADEDKKKTSEQYVLIAEKIIKENKLSPLDLAELESSVAEAYKDLKQEDRSKDHWLRSALAYEKMDANDRGAAIEKAYSYAQAGKLDKAEIIYNKFQKRFPKEFTFFYAHGQVLLNLKKYPEALNFGQKALANSYGDNKLRATHLVASALKELNRKPEAKTLITETLANAEKPADEKNRTHRYIKKLEELNSAP